MRKTPDDDSSVQVLKRAKKRERGRIEGEIIFSWNQTLFVFISIRFFFSSPPSILLFFLSCAFFVIHHFDSWNAETSQAFDNMITSSIVFNISKSMCMNIKVIVNFNHLHELYWNGSRNIWVLNLAQSNFGQNEKCGQK